MIRQRTVFNTAMNTERVTMVLTRGSVMRDHESRFHPSSIGRPVRPRLAKEKTNTITRGRTKNVMR